MKKIVAFGTLREDVVIEYDFSVPMKEMEVKLNKLDKTVGGSVNNTCYYLALKDSKLQVVLCTLNYIDLVGMLKKRMSCVNYRISTTQEACGMIFVTGDCHGEEGKFKYMDSAMEKTTNRE